MDPKIIETTRLIISRLHDEAFAYDRNSELRFRGDLARKVIEDQLTKANSMDNGLISLDVPRQDAALLAKYLKRVTFERTLTHCDGWPVKSDACNDQCYEMISILGNLEKQLDEQR